MQALRRTVRQINIRFHKPPHIGRSILLLGETGAGKNHLARVMAAHHYWLQNPKLWEPGSPKDRSRSLIEITGERFTEVHLPAIPEDLIESELFGHAKGAFTGAISSMPGCFGDDKIEDLLLDEIGDASLKLQVKLLRVLNDKSFKAVGAPPHETKFTNARIFMATNADLARAVRVGSFRLDLYWRMQYLVIRLPALRDQRDRIPDLARSIVTRILQQHGVHTDGPTLSKDDLTWLCDQPWPGNIREMERLLWRWVYEDGSQPLAAVQAEYPQEDLNPPNGESGSLRELLRTQVKRALAEKRCLADSLGNFTGQLNKEAQAILVNLRDELRLDRDALETLFGDGAKAAKLLRQWSGEQES
jgi:DNA-binding NtrC family response regulator